MKVFYSAKLSEMLHFKRGKDGVFLEPSHGRKLCTFLQSAKMFDVEVRFLIKVIMQQKGQLP